MPDGAPIAKLSGPPADGFIVSYAMDVYYAQPASRLCEATITQQAAQLGGRLDYREEIEMPGAAHSICLTFEFEGMGEADRAAEALARTGSTLKGRWPMVDLAHARCWLARQCPPAPFHADHPTAERHCWTSRALTEGRS